MSVYMLWCKECCRGALRRREVNIVFVCNYWFGTMLTQFRDGLRLGKLLEYPRTKSTT